MGPVKRLVIERWPTGERSHTYPLLARGVYYAMPTYHVLSNEIAKFFARGLPKGSS